MMIRVLLFVLRRMIVVVFVFVVIVGFVGRVILIVGDVVWIHRMIVFVGGAIVSLLCLLGGPMLPLPVVCCLFCV